MAEDVRAVRVFVSSPGDVAPERGRVEAVAAKLNREYEGLVRFERVLWEESFYKADRTFQAQIPEAAACDIVVSIFWTRIGTALPSEFAHMPDGRPYLSGTVYELLTALEASKKRGAPDVFVFRKSADAALPTADAELRRQVQAHLDALESFWSEWFKSEKGQFKAAYQIFANPDEFEHQLEGLLRQWLQSHGLLGPRLAWPKEKGSPFRGLVPFEAEHAVIFFGRRRAIDEARRRLAGAAERGTPFLLIVGPSGSGKSSLARAGLIPRLTTPGVVESVAVWRVARMKPSEGQAEPLLSLATALFAEAGLPELGQGDFPNPTMLADHFKRGGEAAALPVLHALERAAAAAQHDRHADKSLRPALLLLVDQLEELFAKAVSDADRATFAQVLKQLIATQRIWTVATLRADLYEQAIKEPTLKALKEAGASLDLGPPEPGELAEIVRAPAEAAGLTYESDPAKGALDDRLLADATTPDSLPLLQFTLQQLYERRVDTTDKVTLTHGAYDALGGLAGAIAAEAERAVSGLKPEAVATLPRLLRRLTEPAHDGHTLTLREALRSEAETDALEAALLDALRAAFIVITSTDAQGRPVMRLAHRAVFESWSRASDAVKANQDFVRVRAEIEDALRPWREHGRPSDRLIQPGVPLAEAENLVWRFGGELPAELTTFVKASGARARWRQRLVAAAAACFFALAVAAGLAWRTAVQERDQKQQALATIVETADTITLDLRQEFALRRIPTDLLKRILDPAIRAYGQAIRLDPGNTALYYANRGAAYGSNGDYDEAIHDENDAIRLNPQYAVAYRNRGIAYSLKGDEVSAIKDYDEAIRLDPNFVSAYLSRGGAYEDAGNYERAIQDYSEAIRRGTKDSPNPRMLLAYFIRGNAYSRLAVAWEQRGDRGRALQDYERAVQDFDRAIELDPNNALAYEGRGTAYAAEGDADHAIRDFNRAIQLDPAHADPSYAGLGMAYELKGDRNQAIQDYSEAIRLDPRDATFRRSRAGLYRSNGDYDRAIQDYDQAIQLDPKSAANSYTSRGLAYELKGDRNQAIQDYSEAIRLDPANVLAYVDRGLAYERQGDHDRAIKDFDRAIQLDPDPKRPLVYSGRATAYQNKREYDRAIADYDQVIRRDPNDTAAYNDRGNAYFDKHEYDRAIEDYDQAVRLDPKNVMAYNNRGNAYLRKRDFDRAIQNYDQAARLDPKNVTAYGNRGLAYVNKGDFDRGIENYNRAIELDAKNALAYSNRGNAYLNMGDYDRAIQDYDQALRLNPTNASVQIFRGLAYFDRGDFSEAVTALVRANELDANAYAMIWLYLARERLGENGAADLEANSVRLKSKDWPYPVIELYLGKRSPLELQSAASDAGQPCDAQLYNGEWYLLRGVRAAAATALKAAVDTCPRGSLEYNGAVAELKRLTSNADAAGR